MSPTRRRFTTYIIIAAVIGTLGLASCERTKTYRKKAMKHQLAVGDMAPDFSLRDDNNTMRKLSDMRGHKVALYFYPKDQTPGCTAQACSIRDALGALTNEGITVWGISYDSVASHQKFREKYHLTFPLLSDSSKKVAGLYGVKGLLLAQRVTFLVDEDGIIVGIIRDIDVANHADQIHEGFAAAARRS